MSIRKQYGPNLVCSMPRPISFHIMVWEQAFLVKFKSAKATQKIEKLQLKTRLAFALYDSSKVWTSNWHASDKLVDNIGNVSRIEIFHASIYQIEHKKPTQVYRLTCK